LRWIVDEHKETLAGCVLPCAVSFDGHSLSPASFRQDSRIALLVSKRAIDAKRSSNREELLRSNAVQEKQNLSEKVAYVFALYIPYTTLDSRLCSEDAVMTASNNITEALQRTMTLMQGELEKSVLSTQLLGNLARLSSSISMLIYPASDTSTASLRSASTTHDVLDGLLSTSKHLITALEKSDWVDRMLIIAALVFFVLVVLFILKQRLVDRSLRIAFWWTRFLPSMSSGTRHSADVVADVVEKGGLSTSSMTELASTILTTATATTLSIAASSVSSSLAAETSITTPPLSDSIPTDVLPSSEDTLSIYVAEVSQDPQQPTSSILDETTTGMSVTITTTSIHDEL
jgi:protein transport protein SEC20